MFSLAGLSGLLKSLLPFGAIVWIGISTVEKHWETVVHASELGVRSYAGFLGSVMGELIWKSGLVLVAWSGVDYMLVRQKLEGDLKMSRQDLKDEAKQTEGNPLIKVVFGVFNAVCEDASASTRNSRPSWPPRAASSPSSTNSSTPARPTPSTRRWTEPSTASAIRSISRWINPSTARSTNPSTWTAMGDDAGERSHAGPDHQAGRRR